MPGLSSLRLILAAFVGGCALLICACNWAGSAADAVATPPVPATSDRMEPTKAAAKPAFKNRAPEEARAMARAIVQQASPAWATGGVSGDSLDDLRRCCETMLYAFLVPDFEAYHSLMQAKGCVLLEDSVVGLVEDEYGGLHSRAGNPIPSDATPLEILRFMWMNPDDRFARWVKIVSEPTGGMGWKRSREDHYQGRISWMLGRYTPAGSELLSVAAKATAGDSGVQIAWVDMRIEMNRHTYPLRVNFARSEETKSWLPIRIDILLEDRPRIGLLM